MLFLDVVAWPVVSAKIARTRAMSRKTRRAGDNFISIAQKSALVIFLNRRPRLSLRSASQSISRE